VWEDPADAEIRVNLASKARLRKLRTGHQQSSVGGSTYESALRKQHAALHPRTGWARGRGRAQATAGAPGGEEEEDEELAQLATAAGALAAPRSLGALLPGAVDTTRMRDANQAEPCAGVVRSVGFHPGSALLMTGSLDKKIRLFQVTGRGCCCHCGLGPLCVC
jgi:U3 small nucleolar RNA-associated protein 18